MEQDGQHDGCFKDPEKKPKRRGHHDGPLWDATQQFVKILGSKVRVFFSRDQVAPHELTSFSAQDGSS